ncbi:hypothetical protein CBR_g30022 [Chara braunii]|uniref:Uncharacterized protein n=1 Tax=Chara braunii TaxID=69332 RepID=A0A388LBS7_CHABU|nr:hypothetical protein CBR_g30022 [Chara braunii]|eukprot:GBG79758.1 hypothetical protein CBR_g30022 [Chara braunii]
MLQFVKSEVNSGANHCEFVVKKAKRNNAWGNNTDNVMWFTLSERKRKKIYEFLFVETWPAKDSDVEYVRRKYHMLVLLDNYEGASRKNTKTFLNGLESLYFIQSEEELKFDNYNSLISTDDEATTDVEPDTNVKEDESINESVNMGHEPFLRPAIRKGEWIMAAVVDRDVGSVSIPRESKSNFLLVARVPVIQKVKAENQTVSPSNASIISIADSLFNELHDNLKRWLELTEDSYDLDRCPSKGMVDWKVPRLSGTLGSSGGGGHLALEETETTVRGGGKGVPPSGEGRPQDETTITEGSGGVEREAVDRHDYGPRSRAFDEVRRPPTSSASSTRERIAALVALGNHSGGKSKFVGIRTTSLEVLRQESSVQSGSGVGVSSQDAASKYARIRTSLKDSLPTDSGVVWEQNASVEGEGWPPELKQEGVSGVPADQETTNSGGI